MKDDSKFINLLTSRILELHQTPKVQVERAVSPILSLFIADALTAKFREHVSLCGEYELVCMEFPLKKSDNAQSTNIDFLLVNKSTSSIAFLELKTDSNSVDRNQLDVYLKLKEEVQEYGGGFLLRNLSVIAGQSARNDKYQFLQSLIEPFKKIIIGASDLKVIYLVPNSVKPGLMAVSGIDSVLSFNDLPVAIEGDLADVWPSIRDCFVKLESMEIGNITTEIPGASSEVAEAFSAFVPAKRGQGERMDTRIRRQIETYCLQSLPPNVRPVYVRLGITGEGGSPNYQVVFTNHQIVPFFNSGKVFTRSASFKSSNLAAPVPWEKLGV